MFSPIQQQQELLSIVSPQITISVIASFLGRSLENSVSYCLLSVMSLQKTVSDFVCNIINNCKSVIACYLQ